MSEENRYEQLLDLSLTAFNRILPHNEVVRAAMLSIAINRQNFEQERLVVITSRHFYRVKYDFAHGRLAHVKATPLTHIRLVEYGTFAKAGTHPQAPGFAIQTADKARRAFLSQLYLQNGVQAAGTAETFGELLCYLADRACLRCGCVRPSFRRKTTIPREKKAKLLARLSNWNAAQVWNHDETHRWPAPASVTDIRAECVPNCNCLETELDDESEVDSLSETSAGLLTLIEAQGPDGRTAN